MFGKRETKFERAGGFGFDALNTPTSIIKTFSISNKILPFSKLNKSIDERPYAEVVLFGNTVQGLLDSGSEVTLVGQGLVKLINNVRVEFLPTSAIIKTADGTQHLVKSSINLPITYCGIKKNIIALYTPSLPVDIILGIDFWSLYNIKPVICNVIEEVKIPPVSVEHDLSISQMEILNSILGKMPFSKGGKLSKTHWVEHVIDTGEAKPIKQRHYIVSPFIQKSINEEIDRLLALDVIEPCANSPWSNPVVAVKKPSGKIRICLDARKLNNVTVKDAYPQQQINRILGRLAGTNILSSIDFSDAFLQVPLAVESRPKTAFAISGRGFFMYKRMAFGLCNSGATLCRLVDEVIGCDLEPNVFVYLDDIIIATETLDHHFEILQILSERIQKAGLTISSEKSKFCTRELNYLGYIISKEGIRPNQKKVEAILNYPEPKNIKDVRRLLGMAGWYRRFIKDFAIIAAPLSNLLKKSKEKFSWNDEAKMAFESVKKILTSEPVLTNANYEQPFIIQCDASDFGIGAVLVQGEGKEERIVAYMSQKLSSAQRKYQTTERECLAVLMAIEKFRPFIEGTKFTVVTDHASLLWLQNLKDPSGRVGRWALRLQAYDFNLVHRKGKFMVVPDALSRAVETVDVQLFSKDLDPWYSKLMDGIVNNAEKFPHFKMKNNVIYKYCAGRSTLQSFSPEWKIVVPTGCRNSVMEANHDNPLCAHGGYYKTFERIRKDYFWPLMQNDIREYIRKCETCKATKPTNEIQVTPMGNQRTADRPWQMLFIDFVGPFPKSKKGFSYILVAVDGFSKYVHIFPLRKATSGTAIEMLENRIFLSHGVPEILISDNGSQFTSAEFNKFLDKYNVKKWLTARYHPQANAAEAANKTVETAIRAYIKDTNSHKCWDENLQKIACAMNSSVHTSTKFSPYFINFGQHMMTSGNEYGTQFENKTRIEDNELKKIRAMVKKNLQSTYDVSKKKYDLRTRPIQYDVGDVIWKQNFTQSDASKNISAKLCPRYTKCVVKKKLGSNTYRLADENGKILGDFNTRVLKK